MGKINKFKTKMKFAAIALLATVSAQVTCTDDDAADVCTEAGACCGYLLSEEAPVLSEFKEGDVARACGDGTGSAAVEYDGADKFSCEAPIAEEEGASKLALGLSAVV